MSPFWVGGGRSTHPVPLTLPLLPLFVNGRVATGGTSSGLAPQGLVGGFLGALARLHVPPGQVRAVLLAGSSTAMGTVVGGTGGLVAEVIRTVRPMPSRAWSVAAASLALVSHRITPLGWGRTSGDGEQPAERPHVLSPTTYTNK
jgi:hypothetical protein